MITKTLNCFNTWGRVPDLPGVRYHIYEETLILKLLKDLKEKIDAEIWKKKSIVREKRPKVKKKKV